MQAQEEIFESLRETLVNNRQRVIVLLRHTGKATDAANRFRSFLEDGGWEKLLKPGGSNPDFVKLTTGAWAFFIACEELDLGDEVGHPDFMLWPTEGGVYALVKHREWRMIRATQDNPWRPVEVSEEPPVFQEGSVWDRLTGKDEIG